MPGQDAVRTGIAVTPAWQAASLLQPLLLSGTREKIRGGSYSPVATPLPLILR